jgi:hypothetical protein
MLGHRRDLAAEQPPESAIASRGLVHRDHVHELVIHQRAHAFVGSDRLEREVEGGDLDRHHIARDGARSRVARVREIGEQHRDGTGRLELEKILCEAQRIQKRACRMRDEVGLGAVEVDQPDFRRLDRRELGVGPSRWHADSERAEKPYTQPVSSGGRGRRGKAHGLRRDATILSCRTGAQQVLRLLPAARRGCR